MVAIAALGVVGVRVVTGPAARPGGGPGPVVRLFGARGSFGALTGQARVPSGESFAAVAVRGWGFLPGQAAYFTVVGPDRTVFIANEPQTDNQTLPTAREMAISTFSPTARQFRNIVIPTSTGADSVESPGPSARLRVGGADISDLQAVTVDGLRRIAFLSAMPYQGWRIASDGVYPTLGYLSDRPDGWSYDASQSVDALAIARSATLRSATPTPATPRRTGLAPSACVQETSSDLRPFADCRLPTEMALLPASHDLVVTQYAPNALGSTSGSLMVLDPRGRLLASYAYPNVALPDGQIVNVHPREVDADPVSPLGDERFVVIFDTTTAAGQTSKPGPFPMQELSYNPATAAITPRSAPILTGDAAPDHTPFGFETAQYDSHGDLWAAQSENGTLNAGPLAIYRRAAGTGATLDRPGCRPSTALLTTSWGTSCRPSTEIPEAGPLGIARSLTPDADTNTMLLATLSGYLLPIQPTTDPARPYRARAPLDLGLNRLTDRKTAAVSIRQGSIDASTHTLWLPVQQLQAPAQCSAYPCAPAARDQWLYGIDLARLLGRKRTAPR